MKNTDRLTQTELRQLLPAYTKSMGVRFTPRMVKAIYISHIDAFWKLDSRNETLMVCVVYLEEDYSGNMVTREKLTSALSAEGEMLSKTEAGHYYQLTLIRQPNGFFCWNSLQKIESKKAQVK